jgi:hypothetical protein
MSSAIKQGNMIDDFKFFQENHIYAYNGEMSREAIIIFREYVASSRANCEITTQIARYRVGTLSFNTGIISSGIVYVYPIADSSMKITFNINMGNATPYITGHEIDYA